MNYITPKEYTAKYGGTYGICTMVDGKYSIVVPFHVNTRVRLHELYHLNDTSDDAKNINAESQFNCDMEAELFAYEIMGRPLHLNVAQPAINLVCDDIFQNPRYTSWVFNKVKGKLESKGVILDRKHRSLLWHHIKDRLNEAKRKRNRARAR